MRRAGREEPDVIEANANDLAAVVAGAVATAVAAHRPEIPAPLKWAGGILAALAVTSVSGMVVWLATSVAEVQITVNRMDERSIAEAKLQDARGQEINRRLSALERGSIE